VQTNAFCYKLTLTIRYLHFISLLLLITCLILSFLYWFAVTASSPGYKSKTTTVWLGENAVTADFILIPETSSRGNQLRSSCDCSCKSCGQPLLTQFFTETNNGITLTLFVVVVFLCFLLQRRVRFNLWKQRQSSRRSITVWFIGIITQLYIL